MWSCAFFWRNNGIKNHNISWLGQRLTTTIGPLPKSVHEDRIKENMDFFDIELSEEDAETIKNLDGMTEIPDPDTKDF